MEESGGFKMISKKETPNLPANSSLLALFWTLAEGKEEKRFEATQSMVKILSAKQGSDVELSKELEYALKRLVKGLASGRKYARLGYTTALTQVLRAFPFITTKHVVRRIQEELTPEKMDLKSDRSNLMLGKVMAYLALIKAETLFKANPSQIGEVVKQLLYIRSKKMPIHQICVQALGQIMQQVSTETFSEFIWKQFEEEMKCGWDSCTPDNLQLLMVIAKHHSSVLTKRFLTEHWKSKKIVSEKNLDAITKVMMKTTADHPIIHNVCYDIVQRAMKQDEFFPVFWKNVVSEKLLTQTLERRFMALQLVLFALRKASTAGQVKIIMNESVVQAIITNICDKNKPLHAASKNVCEDLVSFVAGCPNLDVQLAVISSLVNPPSTVLFDSVTKTKTVQRMVTKLDAEGSIVWADTMMDIILGKTDTVLGDMTNQGPEDLTQWALCELLHLLTSPAMASQEGWYLKLVQFLFLHGFFEVQKTNESIPLCVQTDGDSITEPCRRHLQGAFYKSLDKLSTLHLPGRTSAKDIRPYLNLLESTAEYAQLLLTSGKYVKPHSEFLPEIKEEWEKVLEAVEQIKSKHTKEKKMNEGHAFELLYLCLGFQLFFVPQDAIDILADLHVCCKKALAKKRRMSMKPDLEPEWVEVVTEMLLSLLSQESHLVRVVVTNVFKILSPHMTTPALDLVINVIKPVSDGEGPLEFEGESGSDQEESGSESEDEVPNGEENEESEEDSSDDEDDDDEESEDEGEVDENLRNNMKVALGKAAIDSDEEDVASDLDDDAMFKIDDALSQAFKSMVKNKKNSKDEKEKRQQLKAFKLKSLDLLNHFVSSEPAPHLAIKLLRPLLELMDQGAQDKALGDIGRRASTVFRNLVQLRKFLPDPMLEKECLPDAIQELIDFSAGVHGVQMVLDVSSACIFLVRILLGLEHNLGPSPVRTRSRSAVVDSSNKKENATNQLYDEVQEIISKSLESFCLKRDTHLNHMLFHSMFDRMPGIMWPQAQQLLTLLQNGEIRIFCRTQVCSMLTAMIKKPIIESIGEPAWAIFSDSLIDVLPKMLNDVRSADRKPRFLHELLLLLLRASSVSPLTMDRLLTSDVQENVKSFKGIVKKDTKAVINKILNSSQLASKRSAANEPDGTSPKKKAKVANHNGVSNNGTSATPKSAKRKNNWEESKGSERKNEIPKSENGKKKSLDSSVVRMDENENEPDEPLAKTPKKQLDAELMHEETKRSGKSKRKQSIGKMDEGPYTQLQSPPLENGEMSAKKSKKKSPAKAKELYDPDNLGAGLDNLTPVSKINRRRSTRLSIMKGGTPKGLMK